MSFWEKAYIYLLVFSLLVVLSVLLYCASLGYVDFLDAKK